MISDSGDMFFFHQDVLGNVVALTNETGALVQQYRYTVWGEPSALDASGLSLQVSDIKSPFLFTAREHDAETGLYHYRARAYSPDLGRFLQFDPIDFLGKDGNPVRYAQNAPNRFVDPHGRASVSVGKCEIKILYGHGGKDTPHEFKFSDCSAGAFTGCYSDYTNSKIPPGNKLGGSPSNKGEQDDKQNWKEAEALLGSAEAKAKELCSEQCCKDDPGHVKIIFEHSKKGLGIVDWFFGDTGWDKKLNKTVSCK
jgi:RHS repeat-associated protein